ncbi:MAG TPA: Gfo/Idh/MocA family oxidoreductase [Magnetospirillaceae bacterium]|nr:Gfo/Idh/MocA family oxidoreductase [Magnetospirillaceae bacterium]
MKSKSFNVVIVGGSGFWSESNHIPNLLALKKEISMLNVLAIRDPKNPYATSPVERPQLHKLLKTYKPKWLCPGEAKVDNLDDLSTLHEDYHIDLMILACNPVLHFEYALWALERNISIVCDKPLVVLANAASDMSAAADIIPRYNRLLEAYKKARAQTSYLSFSLLLRRRSLPAFSLIRERLKLVGDQYGAGVNHLNILSHNGIYKYPAEFRGRGAHDFSSGVGALSHTSYHYIDLFNWYLSAARGSIDFIVPRLTNITRAEDYLSSRGYESLRMLNKHPVADDVLLAPHVLACEIDFSFSFGFFRKDGRKIGDGNFINNHTSFSPRTREYHKGTTEPANYSDGGRTSHLYIDIHQSGTQNLQLIKNDIAFQPPEIQLRSRSHPMIKELEDAQVLFFEDAYNQTDHTLLDSLRVVIKSIIEKKAIRRGLVVDIREDLSNVTLFAKFYQLIAENYANKMIPDVQHAISLEGLYK